MPRCADARYRPFDVSRLQRGGLLLPVVVLAACAVALAGNPAVTAAIVAAAGGYLVALLVTLTAVRRNVRALERASSQVSSGSVAAVAEPRRFGTLAPVAKQIAEIGGALESAIEAATTDRLTRVANRPTLLAHLFAEIERVARYNRPLSVAFIDIDHFKAVNDNYGHEVGDHVLRGVAEVFREHTRGSDLVGRYGGEEFVLVLPETTVDDATVVAEKLRLMILKKHFDTGSGQLTVSVSIGVAGGVGPSLRVDQLLRDADAAMYAAKSLGRNQTYVFAETDDDSARIPSAPISADGRERAAEVGELARQAAEAAIAAVVSPLPHYRGKPSSLIAAIAVRLATELELPPAEVERIRVASLLHDVGKIAVPEQILEKPAPLTQDEWSVVVQHPRVGQVIIDQVAAVKDAGAIILHHHERYSGHGYPYGLRGGDIPLGARIVAIADAYDAMVHDRPYRRAISHDAAIAEIRKHATAQFDPELVRLFCDLYADNPPAPDPSLLLSPPEPIGGRILRPRGDRAATA
jgi:diguanylate cyclase (GGDEF)-like protein